MAIGFISAIIIIVLLYSSNYCDQCGQKLDWSDEY